MCGDKLLSMISHAMQKLKKLLNHAVRNNTKKINAYETVSYSIAIAKKTKQNSFAKAVDEVFTLNCLLFEKQKNFSKKNQSQYTAVHIL